MRKAAAAPPSAEYDIFLSHWFLDADVIAGVKVILRREGLRVYVDWIEDAQLSRDHVTKETAELLRVRMRRCRSLVYASSQASTSSKWMPGGRLRILRTAIVPVRIAILPLVQSSQDTFRGQEYLLGLLFHASNI